jgi:hypothetical protein
MNPIDLRIPDECGARIVFNSLYPVKQIPNLIQDVIFIELPNDDYLDVGWYPEHDPNGSYRISLYHGDWSNQLIDPIIATNEIEVARRVRDIIVERCRPTTVTIDDEGPGPIIAGHCCTDNFSFIPQFPMRRVRA